MVERIRNSSLVVGTANIIVSEELVGDTQRKVLVVTNTSAAAVVTLSVGAEAKALSGIVLYPTGSWCESIDNKFIPTNLRVFAVADVAGTIAVHERVTEGERLFERG